METLTTFLPRGYPYMIQPCIVSKASSHKYQVSSIFFLIILIFDTVAVIRQFTNTISYL